MRAGLEGETFHPVIGAKREAEILYLEQFAVPARCARGDAAPLTVWDVGLGAAGNAAHLIRCWERQPGRDLRLLSFDLHDRALRFALRHRAGDAALFPWLNGFDWDTILRDQGLTVTRDGHRLTWEWHLRDFPELVAGGKLPAPELIFYDAYSPAKCPRMWSLSHWQNLRRRCAENCEIAFHSRSTALRVTLLLAGFAVGYGVGIGEKEETTVAATHPALLRRPLDNDWLRKVRRSAAARPFNGEDCTPGIINDADYAKLAAGPQFA